MTIGRIVVIGTSAGGTEALPALVGGLPGEFAAPICIVMHVSPLFPCVLDAILDRAGPLRAVVATDGEHPRPGRIYVAPPDYHLIVEPNLLRLTKGPRENRFRPAIDPLFRSAARAYGPATVGVILTGNLDDGTAGLRAVKQLGGVTIVQDPADALYPSMPLNAIEHVEPDHVVPLASMAPLLARIAATPLHERAHSGRDRLISK
jgi:two-component system chemotaxis response regulator CheB